jgi:hypothetical protein
MLVSSEGVEVRPLLNLCAPVCYRRKKCDSLAKSGVVFLMHMCPKQYRLLKIKIKEHSNNYGQG